MIKRTIELDGGELAKIRMYLDGSWEVECEFNRNIMTDEDFALIQRELDDMKIENSNNAKD